MGLLSDLFSGPADFLFGPGTTELSHPIEQNIGNVGDSLQDVYDMGKVELSDFNDEADSNPFYAIDMPGYSNPFTAKLANKLYGTDSSPIHSTYGGATNKQQLEAGRQGVDLGTVNAVEGLGRNVINGVLDYYTGGLGGTLLDAADRKYSGQGPGAMSKGQFFTNLASSQIPVFDTGYGVVANGVTNGAVRGGLAARASNQDVSKGAIGGAIGGGIGAYASEGLSDYSLAKDNNARFGEGTTTQRLGETSSTPFSGNTAVRSGDEFQNSLNTFQATSPTTSAALSGAGKGGLASYVTGKPILQGALFGAGKAVGPTLTSQQKETDVNYNETTPEFGANDQSFQIPWQLGGQDYSNAYSQPTEYTPAQNKQDWYSQLQQSPWFQGLTGIASKSGNPTLAKFAQGMNESGARDSNPLYTIGQGLAQLYNNKQQQKLLQGQLGVMDQNRGAYMSQLANDLARKDAAAGRNSQYGPRSVELQAKMAALDAQRMPTIEKMVGGIGTLRGQSANTVLETLWKNRQLAPQAYQSLKSLFGGKEEDNA